MLPDPTKAIGNLIEKAPAAWLYAWCANLRSYAAATSAEFVLENLPVTNNADLAFGAREVVRLALSQMSWEALAWAIHSACATYKRWQTEQQVELLWAGPSPANRIAARRIDQVLYDLIGGARREVMLVTFAAAKIDRLASVLIEAMHRHVSVQLVLEFEETSEGQLSYDALRAFPKGLIERARIYHWPLEKRERNQAGRPGKLHANAAVIDDTVVISSANLTDDAFNRNVELGARIVGGKFPDLIKAYFQGLIAHQILVPV
jgi:cardiolipin synthase